MTRIAGMGAALVRARRRGTKHTIVNACTARSAQSTEARVRAIWQTLRFIQSYLPFPDFESVRK